MKSSFMVIETESSYCPECHKTVSLLSNFDDRKSPAFYICFSCGFVGQVGVGPVLRPSEELVDDVFIAPRTLFIDVDYDEPDTSTYTGIKVSEDHGLLEVVNTGDFDADLITIREKYKRHRILCSSSIDHFYQDRPKEGEKT
jgi:predicted RNA-binding Zn-ribbon protein involved in translation (DUF1610 family)